MDIAYISKHLIRILLSREGKLEKFVSNNISKDSANYYALLEKIDITQDWKFRTGHFFDPWDRPLPICNALIIPEMINQNLTFGDICDQVATKIIQTINQSNKKLLVGFSGGVDSTVLLTALLKNQIDTDRLVLLTSATLIIENPSFYKKFQRI